MEKYITVCFHYGNGFGGRKYDFKLADGEDAPKVGDCVRLINKDKKWLYSAGRVQVQKIGNTTACPSNLIKTVYTVKSSEDENREDFLQKKDSIYRAKFGDTEGVVR